MTKVNHFNQINSILIKGNLIDLSKPKIMGILNITPDSFYSESRKQNTQEILLTAEKMINEGAEILDIGGMSTRPGAETIESEVEIKRIEEPIKLIRKEFPEILLSLDTYNSTTAEIGLNEGIDIINDISGGVIDENLLNVVAKHRAPYILTHSSGKKQNDSNDTIKGNTIQNLIRYFSEKIDLLNKKGIRDIIIDPGFGFGKTLEQNFEIIKNFEMLKIFEKPILVGISRKSMIYKTLNTSIENSLNGTTILNSLLLTKGASIFRVHDVKEMKEVIQLHDTSGLFY